MAPSQKIEIIKKKLLLVEGADAMYFFIQALQVFRVNDVQVMDFGGISDLTKYLKMLSNLPNYDFVTYIVIVRDAEIDPLSAVSNIKNSFKQASLPIPGNPFEFTGDTIKTAFMIFPGLEDQNLRSGTLEDLCLEIAKDGSTFDCVDAYLQCLQSSGQEIKRLHKTKLHSYLSGKNDFVGLKIGEAAKAGAWDWEHSRFKQFKDLIKTM